MNSHLRDAGTPAQRAAEAALQAFTKEREAESAYRHFQNKYKKRKDKGWRNMEKMREEKHELKEALAAEQARAASLFVPLCDVVAAMASSWDQVASAPSSRSSP